MARKWTDEQKAEQARKIKVWTPWTFATGPRSVAGKARSAKNRELSLDAAKAKIEALKKEHAKAVSELERLTGKRKASGIDGAFNERLVKTLAALLA